MKNKRNVVILSLLAIIFLAPSLAAYLFYQHTNWLGVSQTNKGELLKPPVMLSLLNNTSKWKLVFWSPEACESACQSVLDKLARTRLALGRRLYDVQIALLLKETAKLPRTLTEKLNEADINLISIPEKESQTLPVLLSNRQLFIADPHNFLILAYQISAKPDDIFQDIKRLLTSKE